MAYLPRSSWDSNLACFFLLDLILSCYVPFFRKYERWWRQVWEPSRVEISVEACSQQVSVLEPVGLCDKWMGMSMRAPVFVAAGLCAHRREELLCFNASVFSNLMEKAKAFISGEGKRISNCWTLIRKVWPSQVEIQPRMSRTLPVDHSARGMVSYLCLSSLQRPRWL